jgi:hypothetical protein
MVNLAKMWMHAASVLDRRADTLGDVLPDLRDKLD